MVTFSDPIHLQTSLSDLTPSFPVREEMPVMHVRKRKGALEPVDVNKIVRAVQRSCHGLTHVDAIRVASKTIGGLYDGATTRELDTISIDTAASLDCRGAPIFAPRGPPASVNHRQGDRRP